MEAIEGKEARPIAMADVMAVIEDTLPSVQKSDLVRFQRFAETGE
jgi:hypothetical protein